MFDMPHPMPFDPAHDTRAYRNALGRFATGITIVTAMTDEGPVGITVNSFASVSLDPALVLWSPDKKSSRHDIFVGAKSFAIHVLSAEQQWLCDRFVKSMNDFTDIPFELNEEGTPVVQDCLAVFECEQAAAHDAGDHTIVLGKVLRASHQGGDALVFANGGFAVLPQPAAS